MKLNKISPTSKYLMLLGITILVSTSHIQCEEPNYHPVNCTHFLLGTMDTQGFDQDQDGVANAWDHCPGNSLEWFDSDRDWVGNNTDEDIDGDGIKNSLDTDMDDDGASNQEEINSGTDPIDPSSIPGLPYFNYNQGIMNYEASWYRGDLHMHTTYSDGHVSVEYRVNEAEMYEMDFISITDHNQTDQWFDEYYDSEEVLLIPGLEYTSISHFNLFGIRTNSTDPLFVASGHFEDWRLAYLQGGLVSLNHYGDKGYSTQWDEFYEEDPTVVRYLDAIEVWNGRSFSESSGNFKSRTLWHDLLNEGNKLAVIGGSDSHSASSPICFPMTFIYAQNLSLLALLEGIRNNHTYVALPYPYYDEGSNPNLSQLPELMFEADKNHDGLFESLVGDSIPSGRIHLHIKITQAHGQIRLIKNGDIIQTYEINNGPATVEEYYQENAKSGDWYSLEMVILDNNEWNYLLISSPIYVK